LPKLIIISNTSWNLYNFRLPLMSRLREEGYEVIAAAPHDKYARRLSEAGFRYIELPMNNKGTNPAEDIGLAIGLYKMFRREQPDVVLTYTPKPNIYASIAGGISRTPVIPNISGLGNVFIRQSIVTRIVKFLYKLALHFPAKVFFQNHDDMELFIHLGLVKESVADRIPGSGINTTIFSPLPVAQEKDSPFVFLLVARMLWYKGIGEFVDAARLLKHKHADVELQLLGFLDVENPQAVPRTQVEQWVDEGIINYLGETDFVINVMRKADCVVLPSYREGLPRTLLEAGSLAKPIVTTDAAGCRDVVDDGMTGFLCKLKSGDDLAEKMENVINLTPMERSTMGALGREKIIREFDERLVIDAYLNAIHAIETAKQAVR
jgi:glycosyltransferase involved in cell wall biosynthesis